MYAGREYINEKMLRNFSPPPPPPKKNKIKTSKKSWCRPTYPIFFRDVTGNKDIIYHGLIISITLWSKNVWMIEISSKVTCHTASKRA